MSRRLLAISDTGGRRLTVIHIYVGESFKESVVEIAGAVQPDAA